MIKDASGFGAAIATAIMEMEKTKLRLLEIEGRSNHPHFFTLSELQADHLAVDAARISLSFAQSQCDLLRAYFRECIAAKDGKER